MILPNLIKKQDLHQIYQKVQQGLDISKSEQKYYEKYLKSQEKANEIAKKYNQIIDKSQVRSGLRGQIFNLFKNSDKLIDNYFEASKEKIIDKLFGKTAEVQQGLVEGTLRRSTFTEKLATGKAYQQIEKQDEDFRNDYFEEETLKKKSKQENLRPYIQAGLEEGISSALNEVPEHLLESFTKALTSLVDENKLNLDLNENDIFKNELGQVVVNTDKIFQQMAKLVETEQMNNKILEVQNLENKKENKITGTKDDPKNFIKNKSNSLLGALGLDSIFEGITAAFIGIKSAALLKISNFAKVGGSFLSKAIGGLFAAALDGIMGYFNADDWGVSKLSGIVGSVLGGSSEGMLNIFANAGKWALLGASIGSVVPVVGTLVGGLVGAVFGAIMGFFGGEKISQWVDKLTSGDFWIGLWDKTKESVSKFVSKIAEKVSSFFSDSIETFISYMNEHILDPIQNWIKEKIKNIQEIITKYIPLDFLKSGAERTVNLIDGSIKSIGNSVVNPKETIDSLGKSISNIQNEIKSKSLETLNDLKDTSISRFNKIMSMEDSKEKIDQNRNINSNANIVTNSSAMVNSNNRVSNTTILKPIPFESDMTLRMYGMQLSN